MLRHGRRNDNRNAVLTIARIFANPRAKPDTAKRRGQICVARMSGFARGFATLRMNLSAEDSSRNRLTTDWCNRHVACKRLVL